LVISWTHNHVCPLIGTVFHTNTSNTLCARNSPLSSGLELKANGALYGRDGAGVKHFSRG
jgi:hypothetical protein